MTDDWLRFGILNTLNRFWSPSLPVNRAPVRRLENSYNRRGKCRHDLCRQGRPRCFILRKLVEKWCSKDASLLLHSQFKLFYLSVAQFDCAVGHWK